MTDTKDKPVYIIRSGMDVKQEAGKKAGLSPGKDQLILSAGLVERIVQLICEQLELDYEEIKGKLPKPEDDALYAPAAARTALDGITPEDEAPEDDAGGDLIE